MGRIGILLIMILMSYGVRSQQRDVAKVTKDTLMFCFDRDYLKISKFNADEYVRLQDSDRAHGISFKVKKTHSDLKAGKILNLNKFSKKVGDFNTAIRDTSDDGKLFERLNNSVVIFVDKSSGQLKFMEMSVAQYSLD